MAAHGDESKRFDWYIVHVDSGFEREIAQAIIKQAEQKELTDLIQEVLVPTEEVVEIWRGKEVDARKLPGYVLVHMALTDETRHLVKNTPKVRGFLGSRGQPSPLTQAAVDRILQRAWEPIDVEIDKYVNVTEGPFTGFIGCVGLVDTSKDIATVEIAIFGRATPFDLPISALEPIDEDCESSRSGIVRGKWLEP